MEILKAFFNSNFFVALTTFIVGIFAIGLYLRQKNEHRREAASLILQEIRFAEQQVRIYQKIPKNSRTYSLTTKLLPTNSWHKNIHLFVKKLKETEIDLISRFYSEATFIDYAIRKIADLKSQFLMVVEEENSPNTDKKPKDAIPVASKLLDEISMNVEFIYNTPAVEKLREMSNKKSFWIF